MCMRADHCFSPHIRQAKLAAILCYAPTLHGQRVQPVTKQQCFAHPGAWVWWIEMRPLWAHVWRAVLRNEFCVWGLQDFPSNSHNQACVEASFRIITTSDCWKNWTCKVTLVKVGEDWKIDEQFWAVHRLVWHSLSSLESYPGILDVHFV